MRKVGFLLLAVLLIYGLAYQPSPVEEVSAASLAEIEKELKQASQAIKEAESKVANAAKEASQAEFEKKSLSIKKADLQKEILALIGEIDQLAIEKSATQATIDDREEELLQTGQELVDAEQRVAKRDELMQNRMRVMYTNGFVSYMDVLFSANSFSDFLDRFDAIQTILKSDRDTLEALRIDKELVEIKKEEVEEQLAEVKDLFYELELKQADLIKKEAEKEVLIASYNENLEQIDETLEMLEVISEEQEKLLVALAAKVSKLQSEKKRIQNPYNGGKLGMPLNGDYRVSSNFGTRTHPITNKKHTHTGIDFAAPSGTAIYAAEAGVVIVSQAWSGYGNCIIIDHGNGLWTLYAHIRNGGLLVDVGDTVKKGQQIAEVGNTGVSTGPHLHFEVRKNEVPVNPGSYLK